MSLESLNPANISDVLGLSVRSLGCHLHILWSITLLEHICTWSSNGPSLDYFLRLGGDPMIILGDLFMHDDVQHTVSLLLDSVGSPLIHDNQQSSHTRLHSHWSRCTCKSSSQVLSSSSIGSQTGTKISIPLSPILDHMASLDSPAMTNPSPDLSTSTDQQTSAEPTPVAWPTVLCSAHFPNVDLSAIPSSTPLPHVTVLHG